MGATRLELGLDNAHALSGSESRKVCCRRLPVNRCGPAAVFSRVTSHNSDVSTIDLVASKAVADGFVGCPVEREQDQS